MSDITRITEAGCDYWELSGADGAPIAICCLPRVEQAENLGILKSVINTPIDGFESVTVPEEWPGQ